jgi:antitoxin MazE
MLVSVVAIGNSKGIRLPKTILEQLNVSDKLDLEVENQQIILKPVNSIPRIGWSEAFIKMHNEHQDSLIITDSNEVEAFEWEW